MASPSTGSKTSSTASRANVVLMILLMIYITNQWSRYSIVYLGGVSTPECPGKDKGDVCHFEGKVEPPLCESYECETEQCSLCQSCYNNHTTSHRNLKYATCLSSTQYGQLVSFAYMSFFCVSSLFAGRLADLYNRKNIIVMAAIGWSVFTTLQSLSENFETLLAARIGMGISHAFSGPASLSLIADLFSAENRAQANGIYTFGIYVGGGLSSISLLAANELGWRTASMFIAILGFVSAIALLVIVREPVHHPESVNNNNNENNAGQEQEQEQDQREEENGDSLGSNLLDPISMDQSEQSYQQSDPQPQPQPGTAKPKMKLSKVLSIIASDRVVLLLFIAAPIRFLGGFAIGTFLPQYINRRFPSQNNIYSTLNALIVSIGGALSSFMGGRITDQLKKRDDRAPALIPALGSILAIIPFIGTMYSSNFYVSMACLLAEYLFAESWFGGALSILQSRVPAQARGVTISIYLFVSGIVGSVAPALLGSLDDGASWKGLQKYIMLFVSVSYIGTFLLFTLIAILLRRSSEATYDRLL